MKKVIALLGLVLATGSISQAQTEGKISFSECTPTAMEKLSLFAGADTQNLLNKMIGNGQCKVVTDLNFDYAAKGLRSPYVLTQGLMSIDNLPYGYLRDYCDGEDQACMDAEQVNRPDEANLTTLFLTSSQIETILTIADDGIAKKHTAKSIYFIADETRNYVRHGEGYDGSWFYFDLRASELLIK